jgi:hypothetical protein
VCTQSAAPLPRPAKLPTTRSNASSTPAESLSIEAFGDWEPTVPNGMAGLKFVSRTGVFYRLMLEADYPNRCVALSAIRTEPWTEHP